MIDDLSKICEITENAKVNNTFKLDSKCFAMAKPNNVKELKELITFIKKNKLKYTVIGNASNIILPSFYDGVVIKLDKLNKYEINKTYVYAEGGCKINQLANIVTSKGYAGLDFATGIPGTVGGSVYGNAGCFGSSISEILKSATVFDGKDIIEIKNEDFKFNYRYSMLKEHKDYIVLSCKFKIKKGNVDELMALVKERTEKRIATQDLDHPSNGSMFRNPEGYSAGKLIDDLGLKGFSVNDAAVSLKHANFIINNGHCTSEDIIELANIIKKKVKKEYDIDLVMEQEVLK